MSLRLFHIAFIVLAALTAAFFARWCYLANLEDGATWYQYGSIGSIVVAVALGLYLGYFIKKSPLPN